MPGTANTPKEKVRELQRKLNVCAKPSKTRCFHALYDRIYKSDLLWEAWRRVRNNGGAAGVDAETIQAMMGTMQYPAQATPRRSLLSRGPENGVHGLKGDATETDQPR